MHNDRSADARARNRRILVLTSAGLVPVCLTGALVWAASNASPTHSGDGRPESSASPTAAARPLAGKIVVLDPGHNPTNKDHIEEINHLVQGTDRMTPCDDTGTVTNDGYPEAEFTMDVTRRTRDILLAQGATVKLTHDGHTPWGPCVDERARIPNEARADASVSIHADGTEMAGARGFHVILPADLNVGRAHTSAIVGPSRKLGEQVRAHFAEATSSNTANYIGDKKGLMVRNGLAVMNLSTVPKVLIECGNMRDAQDAALLKNPVWRQKAAEGIAAGIAAFLTQKL
jgi:N-acetylmuramoyl-L-alanine amidase